MIFENTVLILGAGASSPYGLPTGQKLRKNIISKTKDLYYAKLKEYYESTGSTDTPNSYVLEQIDRFTQIFDKSANPSIDLFLNRNKNHQETIETGKKAITINILESEKESNFREQRPSNYGDWYTYLFKKMTEKLTNPGDYIHFGENKIFVITFNYDRSLEHFLFDSLKNSFRSSMNAEEGMDQLRKIKIHHVYGKINKLPWEVGEGREDLNNQRHYYSGYDLAYIDKCERNIKTIYEERTSQELAEVKRWLEYAERIFFLGFGYAKENLDALGIPDSLPRIRIHGTAKGYNPMEQKYIREQVFKESKLNLYDMDCLELLRNHLF